MKTQKIIVLTIILISFIMLPAATFAQYFPSGGYQGGGHGSGGVLTDIGEVVDPVEELNLAAYPNPFSDNIQLKFNIQENSMVKVEVYDISGRLIETLLSTKNLSPGEYQIIWSGKNHQGSEVTKGVYYYRVRINSKIINKKIIRM